MVTADSLLSVDFFRVVPELGPNRHFVASYAGSSLDGHPPGRTGEITRPSANDIEPTAPSADWLTRQPSAPAPLL